MEHDALLAAYRRDARALLDAVRAAGPDAAVPSARTGRRPTSPGTWPTCAELDRILTTTDPATADWTWTEDHTTGFVVRRMAQETAVHRLDAERAAGHPGPEIDPELASDGVDEFLFAFLRRVDRDAAPVEGSVHLHCTDVPGEWLVVEDGDGGSVVTREHAKGDVAIRGRADDLLRVLWRRLPLDAVDVVGDRAVAERFLARTDLSG